MQVLGIEWCPLFSYYSYQEGDITLSMIAIQVNI